MHKVNTALLLLGVILLACNGLLGCSGSVGNPVTPDGKPQVAIHDMANVTGNAESMHTLWGIWSIRFDLNNQQAIVELLREATAHFDITTMLIPPACNNCLSIIINSFDPVTRIIDTDVALRNPTDLAGYDVRGILYTNDYGHELRNPDDWTGLFDIPGGQTTNPFIAFAKDQPNRKFPPYAVHSEKYLVYIPKPPQYDKITYAVDASWPGNCKEPYEITNFTQEELYDSGMGYAMITVDVHDWQGDVNAVTLAAPAITGEPLTQLTKILGDTWGVLIQNAAGASVGDYKVEFAATSAASGNLALYDSATIKITKAPTVKTITVTAPGEADILLIGWFYSITWSWTGDIPSVNILYYKDNDEGTAVPIENGVPNTGSYLWNPIPNDPSATMKVRVCYNSDPAIYGDSDGFFFIKDPALSGWARTWPVNNEGYGVATDSSGNIYVTGYFDFDNADFDPGLGTDYHSSNGKADVLLSKFDVSGNFQWARTWGGSKGDYGHGVATDNSGNVYVTGYFWGTADFDPGPGIDNHTSNGGADVFLSKLDSNGNLQWARTWGGPPAGSYDADFGYGVATDNSGNVYVTGCFQATVDFDPGTGVDNHTSNGEIDIFLSKFDSNGNFQWALTWGSTINHDVEAGLGVAADDSGNIYVTGYFWQDEVDFDPGPGTDYHWSNGCMDAFISKFDSDGNYEGALTWGGPGYDWGGQGIALDGSGNVYVTGSFEGVNIDFDPGPGISYQTSKGQGDVFISKFGPGGAFKWCRTWGAEMYDRGYGVATDNSGYVYVTGSFIGTVDFDPGFEIDNHTSNGFTRSVFLSKFDSNGNYQWARTWGGNQGDNTGWAVATDGSGYVYVTGVYSGKNVDFDPGPGKDYHNGNTSSTNIFLSKFLPNGYW